MNRRHGVFFFPLFFAVVAAVDFTLCAQLEKSLKFIPEVVDFGTMREEDGKVTMNVKAVNISDSSTFIISARTSCGCSSIIYDENELAPGDSADVYVTYDPLNRPGKFLKTAKIFTGLERIGNSFKLKGTVIPSKKNLDRTYPDRAGCLRLSSAVINAGEVSRRETRPLFVGIYNDSDSSFHLTGATDSGALEAGFAPDSIGPYEVCTLTLMLKGKYFKEKEKDFLYKAFLINSLSGDTITCIPVAGSIVSGNPK